MVWWLILNFWSMRCVGLGSVTYIFTRERETCGTSFGRLSSRWKHHMMSTLKQERMAMLDMSWGQFCLQIEKLSTWPQFWTFSSSSQRRSEAPDLINTVMFVANLKKNGDFSLPNLYYSTTCFVILFCFLLWWELHLHPTHFAFLTFWLPPQHKLARSLKSPVCFVALTAVLGVLLLLRFFFLSPCRTIQLAVLSSSSQILKHHWAWSLSAEASISPFFSSSCYYYRLNSSHDPREKGSGVGWSIPEAGRGGRSDQIRSDQLVLLQEKAQKRPAPAWPTCTLQLHTHVAETSS